MVDDLKEMYTDEGGIIINLKIYKILNLMTVCRLEVKILAPFYHAIYKKHEKLVDSDTVFFLSLYTEE